MTLAPDITPALLAELRAECKSDSLFFAKDNALMLAILDLAEIGLQHAPPHEPAPEPATDWGPRART